MRLIIAIAIMFSATTGAYAAPVCKPITPGAFTEKKSDMLKIAECDKLNGVMWPGTLDKKTKLFTPCVGGEPSKKYPGYTTYPNLACFCRDGKAATAAGCAS